MYLNIEIFQFGIAITHQFPRRPSFCSCILSICSYAYDDVSWKDSEFYKYIYYISIYIIAWLPLRVINKRRNKQPCTSNKLYLYGSHKSLAPTSVPMYQPLKGAAGNMSPPQSNTRHATAGRAYHFKPISANHGNLKYTNILLLYYTLSFYWIYCFEFQKRSITNDK